MTLAVICCYFNPQEYQSLKENYERFLHEMEQWGICLFNAEIIFPGQRPVDPTANLILSANSDHFMWQKERLLNLMVERLPARFDKVAWIDADMTFMNRCWPECVETYLDYLWAVQLFNGWHFEQPDSSLGGTGWSVGREGRRYLTSQGKIDNKGLPGGAWAARRKLFPLYDAHILGGGDAMLVDAMVGRFNSYAISQLTYDNLRHFEPYYQRVNRLVDSNIGNINGDAVHYHHGTPANRGYNTRNEILKKHKFNPTLHIELDPRIGLWRWTRFASQEFRDDVAGYFAARKEDE